MTATIDSGAARTMISPRVVEMHEIPYRTKKVLMRAVLADDSPIAYGNGMIRLETKPVPMNLAGTESQEIINIIDLSREDMLIGYD